ncbi:MAG: hypothetical protein EP344_18735 [Bacteroidetes bacterium]|nr:MAG: hypothetical protein EP344_18735 [Bacteroidota bacterium]
MKNVLLYALFFLSATATSGQDTPEQIITRFFDTYQRSTISEAVGYIFNTNKWMDPVDLNVLKTRAEGAVSRDLVGKYFGYEPLTKRTAGTCYVYYSYLVRFSRQPFRFNFQFYKPDKVWQLQHFSLEDNFTEELEEAGKLYRIPEKN